jgi:hypothetical protein
VNDPVPTKAIAKIGRVVGQSRWRKRTYVTIPLDDADAIHRYLVKIRNDQYIKDYRKL